MSTVIYAVGGGLGHGVRGAMVAAAARRSGDVTTLVVRRGGLCDEAARELPADVTVLESDDGALPDAARGERLVVDTFPTGWRGALGVAGVRRFAARALIARVAGDGRRPLAGSELFEHVALPYPAGLNEWRGAHAEATPLGFVLRPWREATWTRDPDAPVLHVWDPGRRLTPPLARLLARLAVRHGLALELAAGAPQTMRARKTLVLGAGYNALHEALRTGADAAFLPLTRAVDDQERRARRWGRAVLTPAELDRWIAEPSVGVPPAALARLREAATLAGFLARVARPKTPRGDREVLVQPVECAR
jgi:hypothetical protein